MKRPSLPRALTRLLAALAVLLTIGLFGGQDASGNVVVLHSPLPCMPSGNIASVGVRVIPNPRPAPCSAPPPFDPVAKYSPGRVVQDYDPAGVVTVSGGLVSQINDRGPLARHAAQATTANKPGWVASSQSMNNRPALVFTDTTTDTAPVWLDTASWASEAQPETITFVASSDASGSTEYLFDNVSSTLCSFATSTPTTYIQAGGFYDTTYQNQSNNQTFSLVNWPLAHVYTVVVNGSSSRLWVDGQATAAVGSGGTNARTALRIGARGGAGTLGFRGTIGRFFRVRGITADVDIIADHAALAKMYLPAFYLFEGDSRMADTGSHVPVGDGFINVMVTQGLLGRALQYVNLATNGAGATTVAGRITTQTKAYGTLQLRETKFVQWIDINDVIVPPGTVTAANELIALKSNCAAYKTAGFGEAVIVAGCNYTGDTVQASLNALERADGTYPVLAFDSANPITLLDGQHPDIPGNVVLAGLLAKMPSNVYMLSPRAAAGLRHLVGEIWTSAAHVANDVREDFKRAAGF